MRRERQEALRRLYRAHVDDVYAFFAYSVDRAQAEDLTSATFERAIKAFDRYDASLAGERTWVLSIARNLLTDHYRRQKHRNASPLDDPAALRLGTSDESERLERDEVHRWLQLLSEREREIIALKYGADLSGREIAAIYELTEANVHQILSRALRRLRERVERTLL